MGFRIFRFHWLRRLVRRNMQPIPEAHARGMKERLALIYAFMGWNFVTIMLYFTWKKHIPEGPGKIQKIIEILDVDHANVIQFSGFSKVGEYDVYRTKEIPADMRREEKLTNLNPKPSNSKQTLETSSFSYSDESSKTF